MGVLPAKRKRNQQTEAAAVPDALQRRSNAGQRADRGGAQEAGETRICDQKGGWSAGDLLEAPAGQPQFCPGPSMASEEAQKGSKDNGPKATQPKRKRSHHEQGDALERFIKQTAKSQRLDFSPAPGTTPGPISRNNQAETVLNNRMLPMFAYLYHVPVHPHHQ